MGRDIVAKQLVYWAQIPVGGSVFDQQLGPAALTVSAQVAGVCTVTMPANNTVPLNRRGVMMQSRGGAGFIASYNEAGSANNTVVSANTAGAQVATNGAFLLEIARIESLIGGGVG